MKVEAIGGPEMAPVKGQATLDAANARRRVKDEAAQEVALQTVQPDPGKPKTLKQLENIIESNALKGAGLWRIAADALMEVKARKLWKLHKNPDGSQTYKNFVTYAEERFGFKKTYAYDLVKAATRKPEALTEGSARAEMAAERTAKPINRQYAMERMEAAWTRFEDATGDLRDRVHEDDQFIAGWDATMHALGETFRDFIADYATIEASASDVSPLRENSADAESEEDGYVSPEELEDALQA